MDILWTNDPAFISQLYIFFKDHADRVCGGETALTLTPQCIQILHDSFTSILSHLDNRVVSDSLPMLWNEFDGYRELSFIYDIIKIITRLIIKQHGETLHGVVNVSLFTNLQSLVIDRLPLQYVRGLGLRRPSLRLLNCVGCINCLRELLRECGADKTTDAQWSQLEELSLTFGGLKELDSSLNLASRLLRLDLSNNKIVDTETHLQSLSRLERLKISSNCLSRVPLFSPVVRTTLTVLSLNNNQLTSLRGIEELAFLSILDVSNNLLCDHQTLDCLRYLFHLDQLLLSGNPLSFHRHHRRLTIVNIHVNCVNSIKIDGARLSYCEQRLYKREQKMPVAVNISNPTIQDATGRISATSSATSLVASVEPTGSGLSASAPVGSAGVPAGCLVHVSSGRAAKCRTRLVKIVDSTEDESSTTADDSEGLMAANDQTALLDPATSTPPARHNAFRRKLRPRNSASTSALAGQNASTSSTPARSNVEISFPGNRLVSPPKHSTDKEENSTAEDLNAVTTNSPAEVSRVKSIRDELDEIDRSRDPKPDPDCVIQVSVSSSSEACSAPDIGTDSSSVVTTSTLLATPIDPGCDNSNNSLRVSELDLTNNSVEGQAIYSQGSDSTLASGRSMDCSPATAAPQKYASTDDVNNACIAYDPTAREVRYVNVSSKFVLVISSGARFPIIEELPLNALLAAQLLSESYEPAPDEPANETGPVIRLTFELANRERTFVMYDKTDLKKLIDLLMPTIESRHKTLECMKCGERFDESNAELKVKLTKNATDVPIGYDKETLTEVPFCPKCHSDIVLEVPSSRPTKDVDPASSTPQSTSRFPRIQSVVFGDSSSIDGTESPCLGSSYPSDSQAFRLENVGKGESDDGNNTGKENSGSRRYGSSRSGKDNVDMLLSTSQKFEQTAEMDDGLSETFDEFNFCYSDFTRFDNRLALFIDLNVFKEKDEKLLLLIKSSAFFSVGNRADFFSCLLLLSTSKLYIARINENVSSESDFNKWLTIVHRQPITDRVYIFAGFRGQSIVVETQNASRLTLLVSNAVRSNRFVNDIADVVASHRLPIVTVSCAEMPDMLRDIAQSLYTQFVHDTVPPRKVLCYTVCRGCSRGVQNKPEKSEFPVGVMVTFTHICLLIESCRLPVGPPGGSTVPPGTVPPGDGAISQDGVTEFKLLDSESFWTLSHIDVVAVLPWRLAVHFEDTKVGTKRCWNIVIETRSAARTFINATKRAFRNLWPVDLEVNYAKNCDAL